MRKSRLFLVALVTALLLPVAARADDPVTELLDGTAILLSQSGSTSGATSSTSSMTNIFTPSAYADYKRRGGEPTVTVDRYKLTGALAAQQCPATQTSCYRDVTYTSAPQGFAYPHYSLVWKSVDLGATFRLPPHFPGLGKPSTTGTGGGDTHQMVGRLTHKLFFVDLPADCVTMNVSSDFGETYQDDELGCGENPGGIDDRQWVDVDEGIVGPQYCNAPTGQQAACDNVYVSFPNYTTEVAPTLSLARSTHDGAFGSFVTDSYCNTLTLGVGSTVTHNPIPSTAAGDATGTLCPDPADSNFWIAGPLVADKSPSSPFYHRLYIPFVRSFATVTPAVTGGPPYKLYLAYSDDGGASWLRRCVQGCVTPIVQNPANLFPELTIDTAGNLYYVWAQTQGSEKQPNIGGETDVYYSFSTSGGTTWSQPIPLTQENGDSAVMPWAVAGDPGQVDLVYYKSDTGLNPNVAFIDQNGNPCEEDVSPLSPAPPCPPTGAQKNPSVWNVFFAQSQNALNTGSNFKSVQISDHPIHLGQVCTAGLLCTVSGDRSLLDFFTVDVDHLGAAVVAFTDTNNSGLDRRVKVTRQVAGASIFKGQNISLQSSWPIRDHSVSDPIGDVKNADGLPPDTTVPDLTNSCPGMDVLRTSVSRSGDLLTVSLTLNGPPTALNAMTCGGLVQVTGGIWGAEFWASAIPQTGGGGDTGPDNFYVAYRDNPLDGPPGVEAGRMNSVNEFNTSNEFHPLENDVLGGNCLPAATAPSPCTLTLTASLSGLLIKQGAGLYSITGLSVYQFGSGDRFPSQRRIEGHSEQADVTPALDDNGTGTTTK
jgi:hypothetical protein